MAQGGVEFLGIPSGFKKLDDALLGFRNNAFYVVGASTSMGKTAWATSALLNMARKGTKVLYITLEMSAELILYRLLSSLTKLPTLDIERGRLNPQQHADVARAREELAALPITFIDSSLTTDQLMYTLLQAKDKDLVDIVLLDYLTLVQVPQLNVSIYERVSIISEFVRIAARDLDIPFITLAQLNREVDRREDKTPIISDLRDSGGIGQDAHAILFLTRPHYYARMYAGAEPVNEEKDAAIILAKNRQGPTGRLTVTFVADRMEWLDPYTDPREPASLADRVRQRSHR